MEIKTNKSKKSLQAIGLGLESAAHKILGKQLIVELYDCNVSIIDDVHIVERLMLDAAEAAHATVLGYKFHKFSPQGVSGAVIVAESHLAIHTWPEYGYCAVDIFTCGQNTDNNAALKVIKDGVGAGHLKAVEIKKSSSYEKIDQHSDFSTN